MNLLFNVSKIRNREDKAPLVVCQSWEGIIKAMARHKAHQTKEDAPLWCPTEWKQGEPRDKLNLENGRLLSVGLFVADFDDGTIPSDLCERWRTADGQPLAYVLYSSYNHTKAAPRWRLVIPFTAPVPATEWKTNYWPRLSYFLCNNRNDASAKDAARFYYFPSCPPDGIDEAFSDVGKGLFLDPDTLPELPEKARPQPKPSVFRGSSEGRPGDDFNEKATPDDVLTMLRKAGWDELSRAGDVISVIRPGKQSHSRSGTIGHTSPNGFYCFSDSAAPLETNTAYTPFKLFAVLECNGDFKEAARRLGAAGYGERNKMARQPQERDSHEECNTPPLSPDWTGVQPLPLSTDLLPVPALSPDLLPDSLRPWITDIATRGSFPIAYVAIAAMVSLSVVIGRQIGIRPKTYDDWLVIPNLWGAIVGHPGVMKTPAVTEALKPLYWLEAESRERYHVERAAWEEGQAIGQAMQKAAKAKLETAVKKGGMGEATLRELARQASGGNDETEPICRRFIVNDTSVEKLGELLRENPHGLGLHRDELTGFFKTLERQGHESDRAFYLEAWNGSGSFTYDRIGRGTVHIPSLCMSLVGTIQPGPLAAYLRRAGSGEEADGFMSRLQLLVWPDPPKHYTLVDRFPSKAARETACSVFSRLASIDAQGIGAHKDAPCDVPFLRFDLKGQMAFNQWRETLENRLLSGQDSPLMQMHLAKYRSLVPSLALIFHLADNGEGPVSGEHVELAIAWASFLETHACRLYQFAQDGDPQAVMRLAERVKQSLPNPFTIREVVKKGWCGLSTPEEVERACNRMEERRWLIPIEERSAREDGKGRPSVKWFIHPELIRGNADTLIYDFLKPIPGKNGENFPESISAVFAGNQGEESADFAEDEGEEI